MESPAVGSQRRGQSLSVPAVVLGARSREAVAKAVELLGIDGVNIEPAIKKRLDDGAVRNLDRNMHIFRAAAACGDKPIAHLRKPFAAVLEGSFAKAFAAGIGKPDIVLLGCPIDLRKEATAGWFIFFRSPLAKAEKRAAETDLRRGPLERHALAGPLLQRLATGRNRLLKSRRAALPLAKAPKRAHVHESGHRFHEGGHC